MSPPNLWKTAGSPHRRDWIMIDFGAAVPIDSLRMFVLDDSTGVRPPVKIDVHMWRDRGYDSDWYPITGLRQLPATLQGHRATSIAFPRISTPQIRIALTPQSRTAVGLTELEVWGPSPNPTMTASANLAWGAKASASFTSKYDSVEEINDMVVAFSRYSRNRWTAFGTPNASDWVQLDLRGNREVDQVELYLWGDSGGVKAPKSYMIQTWNGTAWVNARVTSQVPLLPLVSSVNTVHIKPVTTNKIRIVFQHDLPAATGVTEVRVFGTGQ
jgi:hypothetical protein